MTELKVNIPASMTAEYVRYWHNDLPAPYVRLSFGSEEVVDLVPQIPHYLQDYDYEPDFGLTFSPDEEQEIAEHTAKVVLRTIISAAVPALIMDWETKNNG